MAETDASARTSEPPQAIGPVTATETAAGTVPRPMAEEGEEAMLPKDAEHGGGGAQDRAGVGGEGEEETAETGSKRPRGDGEGNGSGITQAEVHEPETSEAVNGEAPVDESMLCSSEVIVPKECSELPQEDDVPSPEQQSAVVLTQENTQKIEIPQSKVDVGDSSTLAARSFGTLQSGAEQVDIHVPNEKAGLVIGEGGETIKALKTKSGADIELIPQHLPEGDLSTETKIRLTGNWNQIEIARTMVLELISQVLLSPGSSSQMGGHEPGRAPQWGPDNGYDYLGGMYYQNPQYHLDGVYSKQTAPRGGMDTGWNQMSGGGTGQAPYQGGCSDYYASYNPYSARGPPSGVQAPMYHSARGPTGAQAPIHHRNWSPQVPVGYTSSYPHSAPGQLTSVQGYNGQCHGQQSMNFQPVYQSYPPQQDPYGKSAFGGAQQGYGIPTPGTNYQGPTPAQQPHALQSSTVPPQPGLGYDQPYGATAGATHRYVQSSSGYQQPASQVTSVYPQQVMQPEVYEQHPSTQPGYTDQAIANNANYHQQPASHVASAYLQQGMQPGVYWHWQYPSTQPAYTDHAVANNANYQQPASHVASAYPQQGMQPAVYGQYPSTQPAYTNQAVANNANHPGYPQQGMQPAVYGQYPSTRPAYTGQTVANNANYQQLASHASAAYPQQGVQPGVYGQHPLYAGQAVANNPNYQQPAIHVASGYPQQGMQPGVYGQYPRNTDQAVANNPNYQQPEIHATSAYPQQGMQPGALTQPGYTDQPGHNGGSIEATAYANKKPVAGDGSVPEGDAVNQAQAGNVQPHATSSSQAS